MVLDLLAKPLHFQLVDYFANQPLLQERDVADSNTAFQFRKTMSNGFSIKFATEFRLLHRIENLMPRKYILPYILVMTNFSNLLKFLPIAPLGIEIHGGIW